MCYDNNAGLLTDFYQGKPPLNYVLFALHLVLHRFDLKNWKSELIQCFDRVIKIY